MGTTSDILSTIDIDQLASTVGADPADVSAAASTAVRALLGGVQGNLDSPDGATSFANALGQHIDSPGGDDLSAIDTEDGAKIVDHVLGSQQQLALTGGAQGSLISKLLPILAPIVLNYLAKRLGSSLSKADPSSGGDLGSILGSVLGGSAGGSSAGDLGSILGSVLGGSSSGGLGSILGQILNGSQSGAPTTSAPGTVPTGGGLGDVLGQVLGGVTQQASNKGLTMPDPMPTQGRSAQSSGGGLGGLLQSILFG